MNYESGPRSIGEPLPGTEKADQKNKVESEAYGINYDLSNLTESEREQFQKIADETYGRDELIDALYAAGFYPGPGPDINHETTKMELFWHEDAENMSLDDHEKKYGPVDDDARAQYEARNTKRAA